MLNVVPAGGAQSQFVECWHVPEPGGGDEETTAGTGCVKKVSRERNGRERYSGPIHTERIGFGSPRRSGKSGAPSHISGGATIIKRRCCTMWTWSSRDENVSIGDAKARKSAVRPPR